MPLAADATRSGIGCALRRGVAAVLTAHIAQFIETREGRVASIETFDCYERFV